MPAEFRSGILFMALDQQGNGNLMAFSLSSSNPHQNLKPRLKSMGPVPMWILCTGTYAFPGIKKAQHKRKGSCFSRVCSHAVYY